jgi:hypothetical protein
MSNSSLSSSVYRSIHSSSDTPPSISLKRIASTTKAKKTKTKAKKAKTNTSKTVKLTPSLKATQAAAEPQLSDAALEKLWNSLERKISKKTHLVGSAKIVLSPNLGVPGAFGYSFMKRASSYWNVPSLTTGLMSLSDGSLFSIGFFSVVRESYAKRLSRWSAGDEIQYEYYGNIRAHLFSGNSYLIKNITKNSYIYGQKLDAMY